MIAFFGARIAQTNEKFIRGHEFNRPVISSTAKFATFKQGLTNNQKIVSAKLKPSRTWLLYFRTTTQ